jgi:hypothetical protein
LAVTIMFRARLIASLLIPAAVLFCACSSSSTAISGDAPDPDAPMGNVGCMQAAGDAYTPGMEKFGNARRYSFALLSSSPAPPALNDNTFVLQVKDAAGELVEGDLSVALEMPEHGHQSPKQPDITFDADSSTFTLDPMRLFMVGLWSLTFSFRPEAGGADGADSAVFKFCID